MKPFFPSLLLPVALLIGLTAFSCGPRKIAESQNGEIKITELASGLNHPWAMAFLPDGRLLVTERSGDLRILQQDTTLSNPLEGVPEVFSRDQGGLLDVALHPQFNENQRVYLSFAEAGENNTAATSLGFGTLSGNAIHNFEVIFRQGPKVEGGRHFGNRIIFQDEYLFLALGDRGQKDPAQDLSNQIGTVIRINPDGTIPDDNPFVDQENAAAEIWSYGHRNIQAAAVDPNTGLIWVGEMGPQNGDELNIVERQLNYGWPEVSWGENYDGSPIPDHNTRPEFTDAQLVWTPVISPSGMIFYSGDMFPEWKNKMIVGGLTTKELVVVDINNRTASESHRITIGERVRDVQQAPDGSVYVITDVSNGKILRLTR